MVGSVALLTVAVGAAGWWGTHPGQTFSSAYGMETTRPPGQTSWTSLVHPRNEDEATDGLLVTGLTPRVVKDTAESTVEYVICVLDPDVLEDEGVGGFIFGGSDRDIDHYCTSTRPAIGSTLHLGADPLEELLVGITPSRPGRTVVADHEIAYRDGWQRGHATITVAATVTTQDRR